MGGAGHAPPEPPTKFPEPRENLGVVPKAPHLGEVEGTSRIDVLGVPPPWGNAHGTPPSVALGFHVRAWAKRPPFLDLRLQRSLRGENRGDGGIGGQDDVHPGLAT